MPNKNLFSLFDLYTIKDVFGVWLKSWKKIVLGMALFATFGAYWALSETPRYTAEGSFREKNHARGGVAASTLSAILLSQSSDTSDSSAVATMKSRSMMENLIRKLGLQASITRDGSQKSLFRLMVDNLRLEYALFMNRKTPVVNDPEVLVKVSDIQYTREVPTGLKVEFLDSNNYVVKGSDWEAPGTLGKPFIHEDISFTLNATPSNKSLQGEVFNVGLFPLHYQATDLSKLVTILTDKDDQSVLRIRYRNEDRHRAVNFVNTLMALYQDYIDADHKKMMSAQISYLQKRQNEVFETLKAKMQTYADTLSEDFSKLGFIDSQRAMEFLAANQHGIKSKQLAIGLEIQRLQKVQAEGKSAVESLNGVIDSPFINKLLAEIKDLKQQYDGIQVALSITNATGIQNQKAVFEKNIATLTNLSRCKRDTCNLLALLEKGRVPPSLPESLNSPDFMVDTWHAKLRQEPSKEIQDKFQNYLQNLLHHFEVYSKAIEENLAHQQSPAPDLQGITLNIANEMFMTYSREVNQIEEQIQQFSFIIDQLQQPSFELSSLSAITNDPVTRDIATSATNVALALNDRGNRTEKEIARLQDDLKLQRKFLTLHLKQTKDLLEIKQNLLHSKIQAVRQATLGTIQQMVGVAQNQIAEQIQSRINNLKQELALLDKQQEDLQKQMSSLPKQWVSEQLIHQHMEMHRQMGREITSLVESKNISSNLEIMQSAPVDIAIAPLHPDSPRLLFFTFFSAFVGLFIMSAWTLVRALGKGIPASSESLRLAGMSVAGSIKDNPLTLKRAVSMLLLDCKKEKQQTVLVAQGLQKELTKQLQAIIQEHGVTCAMEQLNSPLPQNAEWVLLFKDISPSDPEILTRLDQFDHFIGVVDEEPLADLEPLIQRIQQRESCHKAIFITLS